MPPSDSEFDFIAKLLSEDISTTEEQLEKLGPTVFSNAQLIEMRGRFSERLDNFSYFQKKTLNLAMWSPSTLLVGGVIYWLGMPSLGLITMVSFPVLLITSIIGVFMIYQNFGNRGQIENCLQEIENELRKRKARSAPTN